MNKINTSNNKEETKGITIADLKKAMKELKKNPRIIKFYLNSKAYRELVNDAENNTMIKERDPLNNYKNYFDGIIVSEHGLYPEGFMGIEYEDKFTIIDMINGKAVDVAKPDGLSGIGCLSLKRDNELS